MNALTWNLPSDLLAASVAMMRPHGRVGNEGLALWLGRNDGQQAIVTHMVSLRGAGFRTSPLQLRLSWHAMSKLTDLADSLDTYLLGQIHSHPGVYLDLSEPDQVYGVRCQDYLSVVCPHYAQRDVAGLDDCGVHLFDEGAYRRLLPAETTRRITLSPVAVTEVELEVPK